MCKFNHAFRIVTDHLREDISITLIAELLASDPTSGHASH